MAIDTTRSTTLLGNGTECTRESPLAAVFAGTITSINRYTYKLENGASIEVTLRPTIQRDSPWALTLQYSVPSVLYGHNLGGNNYWRKISASILKVCEELGLLLTPEDIKRVKKGHYRLLRMDVCFYARLPPGMKLPDLIKYFLLIAAHTGVTICRIRRSVRSNDMSLLMGKNRRYSKTKFYDKLMKLFASPKTAKAFLNRSRYARRVVKFLADKFRVEYSWETLALAKVKEENELGVTELVDLSDPRSWTAEATRRRTLKQVRKHINQVLTYTPKPVAVESLSQIERELLDLYYQLGCKPVPILHSQVVAHRYHDNILAATGVDIWVEGGAVEPVTIDILEKTWFRYPKPWEDLFDSQAWREWHD